MWWAWVPFVTLLAVSAIRSASILWAVRPAIGAGDTLPTWEESNRRFRRFIPAFYFNTFSGPVLLLLCLLVNAALPTEEFGMDGFRQQAWIGVGLMIVWLLVLQALTSRYIRQLARLLPELAKGAAPLAERLLRLGMVMFPLCLLVAALSAENPFWIFGLEGSAILMSLICRRLFTRYLEKRPVVLDADGPVVIKIREAFEREGVHPKRFSVTRSLMANGYVLAAGAVTLTTSLIWLLTPDEVAGVMTHELCHYRNHDRKRIISRRALFAVPTVALICGLEYLLLPSMHSEVLLPEILADLMVLSFVLSLATRPFTRKLEFECDAAALRSGLGPELASALDKMARYMGHPRAWPGLHGLFITHPSYGERIARLELPPAIPSVGTPSV